MTATTSGVTALLFGVGLLAGVTLVVYHFKDEVEVVRAPSTGLVVGVLENAVAYPGHPLCHFVSVDETTADIIRDDIERGVFDVYREGGFQWLKPRWYATHGPDADSEHAKNDYDTEREETDD